MQGDCSGQAKKGRYWRHYSDTFLVVQDGVADQAGGTEPGGEVQGVDEAHERGGVLPEVQAPEETADQAAPQGDTDALRKDGFHAGL
jgi:hypothetical protein